MSDDKYLVRSPLLDAQQRVLGYKLGWQKTAGLAGGADLPQLAALVARCGTDALGTLFLEAGSLALPEETVQALPPRSAVLMLGREALLDPGYLSWAEPLREKGFGLALRGADLAFLQTHEALLSTLTHLEVRGGHPDLAAMNQFAMDRRTVLSVMVDQYSSWQEFDACTASGMHGFFGALCRTTRSSSASGVLGPQAALILQLMQMVQANADARHLEKLLKRDAVLSYKLFRYINSASFGIEVEIQSLRHAVAMLGYTPLFRWLSLLLAMTNTVNFSPALLQAAIVRGRLTELLGQGLLSRAESDDLFVVGMFSLLGQMLGVPITQVLNQIVLPDAIVQALLSREGKYGPFMLLAEACEQEDGCAADFADALFITATRVNDAHLSALAWAQSIKL